MNLKNAPSAATGLKLGFKMFIQSVSTDFKTDHLLCGPERGLDENKLMIHFFGYANCNIPLTGLMWRFSRPSLCVAPI